MNSSFTRTWRKSWVLVVSCDRCPRYVQIADDAHGRAVQVADEWESEHVCGVKPKRKPARVAAR